MQQLSLEEVCFVQELREKGLSDREIAFLLVRKDLTNERLINLYQEKYAQGNTRG